MNQVVTDPLARLVVDESDLAREALAGVLEPYLRFTPQGHLVLQREFDALDARRKVLCLLLAIRALHVLELRQSASAAPQELAGLSGMAGGTVRPTLAALLRERLVSRERALYTVAPHAVRRASDVLMERNVG